MGDTLHLYAQAHEHQDAWVVGNREALTKLRDMLTQALDKGEPSSFQTFSTDGEGYSVLIVPVEESQMQELAFPYTQSEAGPNGGQSPFTLLTREKYRELASFK